MVEIDLSELRGKVVKFEELIASAMRERLTSSYPIEIVESMLEVWGSRHLNLSTFLDTYVESKVFPLDRLERVMDYLFDVELETYFIFDVDFGGYNRLTHQGFNSSDPANTPHLWLSRLSLEQSLIGKSRILWERYMNLILFLEIGVDLDKKLSKRSSKRTFFSNKFASVNPRWEWLVEYQPLLDKFDARLRIPESHKMSTLRGD